MYDIRLVIQKRKHVQCTTAEEPEAFILVPAHSVYIGTVKVVFIVHKVPRNTVQLYLFDSAVLPPPSKLHFKITRMRHLPVVFSRDLSEIRKKDPHIVSFLSEYRSKSPDHVSKPAGFYERDRLTGNKQDFQCIPS